MPKKKKVQPKYGIIDKDLSVKYAKESGKLGGWLMKGTGNKKTFNSRDEANTYRIMHGCQRGKVIRIN